MPRWVRSTQVVGGAFIAAVSGLATGGYVDPEAAAAVNTFVGSILALLRFRPGAGQPIVAAQERR